jgi:uncharacterized circularly permuted ATP-grasp superfamily protein
VIGPRASDEQRRCRRQIEENPRGFIAQEVISLSRHPTFLDGRIEGRHIDLRPSSCLVNASK